MNNNNNNKNKNNNKKKNNKRRNRRFKRNIYQRMKPITIKNKVLSLGSGRIVNNYEYELTGDNSLQSVTINQVISANLDSSVFFSNYVYCKLIGITVTIIPSNISGEVLANIRWNGSIQSVNNLKQDNSTRRVPTNIRNYKNIYIKIPSITVVTTDGYPIQLNQLITTNQVAKTDTVASYCFPGTMYFSIPSTVVVRINVKIGFRQNDTSVNSFQKSVRAELLKGKSIDDLIEEMNDMKLNESIPSRTDKIEEANIE